MEALQASLSAAVAARKARQRVEQLDPGRFPAVGVEGLQRGRVEPLAPFRMSLPERVEVRPAEIVERAPPAAGVGVEVLEQLGQALRLLVELCER